MDDFSSATVVFASDVHGAFGMDVSVANVLVQTRSNCTQWAWSLDWTGCPDHSLGLVSWHCGHVCQTSHVLLVFGFITGLWRNAFGCLLLFEPCIFILFMIENSMCSTTWEFVERHAHFWTTRKVGFLSSSSRHRPQRGIELVQWLVYRRLKFSGILDY